MPAGEHPRFRLAFGEIGGAGMSGNAIGTSAAQARESETPAHEPSNGYPTTREIRVLALAGEGKSNKMIAACLGISQGTTKIHMSNAIRKLNAADRTHAVVLSIRNGWI
jgi:DNA-binding NarL/FixJ family response regulator